MKVPRWMFLPCLTALAGCPDDGEDPPGAEMEITLRLLPPSGLAGGTLTPSFVAYQDGDNEWKIMPGQDGVHRAMISSQRYGVAVGCLPREDTARQVTFHGISLVYSTLEEATTQSLTSCYTPPAETQITGTVLGLGANEGAYLQTGEFINQQVSRDGTFSLRGPQRKMLLFGLVVPATKPFTAPARLLRLPDVDFASAAPLTLDLSQAVAPVAAPLTISGGESNVLVSTVIRRGADQFGGRVMGSPTEYLTAPASQLRDGDLIRVGAFVNDDGISRSGYTYLSTPGPAAIDLPPALRVPVPTVPRTGKRLLSAELPSANSAMPIVTFWVTASTSDATSATTHFATISGGWRGDGAKAFTMPDLSALPGYLPSMSLAQSGAVSWTMYKIEQNEHDYVPGHKALMASASGSL